MNAATLSRTFLSIALMLILAASLSLAQVPKTISYQGVLTDASGTVVPDGNYNLTFKLYDVATGGTALWAEGQLVAVSKGIFNVILGSVAPLNLPFNKPYYLGVTVGAGTELSPRMPLTSSGYSFRAANADSINGITAGGDLTGAYPNPNIKNNAVTTSKIADQAVTQAKLAPGVSHPPGGSAGGALTGTYPIQLLPQVLSTQRNLPTMRSPRQRLLMGLLRPPRLPFPSRSAGARVIPSSRVVIPVAATACMVSTTTVATTGTWAAQAPACWGRPYRKTATAPPESLTTAVQLTAFTASAAAATACMAPAAAAMVFPAPARASSAYTAGIAGAAITGSSAAAATAWWATAAPASACIATASAGPPCVPTRMAGATMRAISRAT